MKIDREQLAWAAGFYDGEGCTGCYPAYRKIITAVPQTHPGPIYRFWLAIGKIGRIHTIEPSGRAKLKRWVWQAQSFEHCQAMIALLWVFLSAPKREQALEAFKTYAELV